MSDFARYEMSDGTIIDIGNSSAQWDEGSHFDGSNHISLATGSQWAHQRLYRSRRGRYYIERTSQWQGSTPSAEWLSNEEACRWLLTNEHAETDDDFPEDLKKLVEDMID